MRYTQKDSNTGVLKFYGPISTWWNSADDFTRTFEEMEGKFKNIDIRVHCYGGEVLEGTVIHNCIKKSKSNVTIYIDGVSASMMSVVMLSANKIIMAPNAFIMIHSPSGYTAGTAKDHRNNAKLLDSMEKNFARAYAQKTGKAETEVQKWFDGSDHWFDAEEALEDGLIDEIGDEVASASDIGKPDQPNQIETLYNQYTALVKPSAVKPLPTATTSVNNNKSSMKKDLIARFALTGVDENSTDHAVMEALVNKFGAVEARLKEQTTAQITALIATAEQVSGKAFEPATKAHLIATGEKAGVSVLQGILGITAATNAPAPTASAPVVATAAPVVAPQIVNMLNTAGGAGGNETRKDWTWDMYQEKDPTALEGMSKSNPDQFKALYKAKYGAEPNI